MAWRERVSQSFEWLFHRFAQGKPHLGDSEAADISTVSFDRYLNLVSLHWVQLIHIRDLRNGENNETYTCDTISIYIYIAVCTCNMFHLAVTLSLSLALCLSSSLPVYINSCIHDVLYPIPRPDFEKKLGAGVGLQGPVYLCPGVIPAPKLC